MPASFKIRTAPLDGIKVEEVLDPDFGISAIVRISPIDCGKDLNVFVHLCWYYGC